MGQQDQNIRTSHTELQLEIECLVRLLTEHVEIVSEQVEAGSKGHIHHLP